MTPSPKYLKPLLVVSVLFKVFLIGGVGGGLYHWLANTKPAEAVRRLTEFTWNYYIAHPEFLTMLNSALNMRRTAANLKLEPAQLTAIAEHSRSRCGWPLPR